MAKQKVVLVNPQNNWGRLRPHLKSARVQAALTAGMRVWCRDHAYLRHPANGAEPYRPVYDAKYGPWSYSRTDYWCDRKRPTKDSPDWYACILGCHWLRGFEAALGEAAFPSFRWLIVGGETHSTAVGIGPSSTLHVLDFLLWDLCGAEEILKCAGWPTKCDLLTVGQEIGQRSEEFYSLAA